MSNDIKLLQEENKKLKEKIEHLLIDLDGESEYKLINEKAIEYIKEQTKGYQDNFDMVEEESWLYDLKIVLNILKGDNN